MILIEELAYFPDTSFSPKLFDISIKVSKSDEAIDIEKEGELIKSIFVSDTVAIVKVKDKSVIITETDSGTFIYSDSEPLVYTKRQVPLSLTDWYHFLMTTDHLTIMSVLSFM